MHECPLCSDDEICPGEHCLVEEAPMLARIAALETQITEERAKREAVSEAFQTERTMLVENQFALAAQADKAERELAEEREKVKAAERDRAMFERSWRDGLVTIAERTQIAEASAARVAELEGVLHHYAFCPEVPGGTPLEKVPEWLSKRVADLQALVDAATRFEFGDWEARDRGDGVWIVRCDVHPLRRPPHDKLTRDEAVAIARDLAAKEKGPTR